MIKNKKLQEILKGYDADADVIFIGVKHEICHVGMPMMEDGAYKIVLSDEKPTHCCDKCGENVYWAGGVFYCVHCNEYLSIDKVTRL